MEPIVSQKLGTRYHGLHSGANHADLDWNCSE